MRTLVPLLLLSGCMSRQILQVQDGPSQGAGQTTVLTTYDIKNYLVFGISKQVYWECSNSGSGLTCRQTCDIKDDQGDLLACPTTYGGGL